MSDEFNVILFSCYLCLLIGAFAGRRFTLKKIFLWATTLLILIILLELWSGWILLSFLGEWGDELRMELLEKHNWDL